MTAYDVDGSITLDTPLARTLRCSTILAHAPLFQDLGRAKLLEFIGMCRRETWPKGNPGLSRGSAQNRFHVLVSGRMKLTRSHPDTGREITLLMLGPGDAYDVNHLLQMPVAQDLTAMPLDRLELLAAPVDDTRAWMELNPGFIAALMRYLNRQLQHAMDLATDLSLYDTEIRLLKLLVRHHSGKDGEGCPLTINDLPHEELASLIGSVRAVVNRHLQDLKQHGIVMPRRGNLQVKDMAALTERVEGFIDSSYGARRYAHGH